MPKNEIRDMMQAWLDAHKHLQPKFRVHYQHWWHRFFPWRRRERRLVQQIVNRLIMEA